MFKRRKTREVRIGNVGVGGDNPLRIQSMTTSDTRDIQATLEQIMRLSDAGCEIARVTVQGIKEAEACGEIKNALLMRGYTIPLVADIHFFPSAAMHVIDFVDKVRINPGNYVDKRASFKTIEYDDASYARELEKIEEKFTPLVEKCKRLKRAMRIGTNHGSLSDRIMNRYGDTPRGMVESALEFARICRKHDYHDFLFSMKSSNPKVMILAYRLLVSEMRLLGWDYPLHLGVTEAGEGEEGRIKSAMGIGALLLEGIGDTIRVSLTEDPWYEIDPCKRLIAFAKAQNILDPETLPLDTLKDRFPVKDSNTLSLHPDGTVILSASLKDLQAESFNQKIADCVVLKERVPIEALQKLKKWGMTVFYRKNLKNREFDKEAAQIFGLERATIVRAQGASEGQKFAAKLTQSKTDSSRSFGNPSDPEQKGSVYLSPLSDVSSSRDFAIIIRDEPEQSWSLLETFKLKPSVILLAPSCNRVHYARQFSRWLHAKNLRIPLILSFDYTCSPEDLIIHAAAECGALLCDGIGDGIWIQGNYDLAFLSALSFNILQAARLRSSKTEFISCPGCGRTLFNLQEVSQRIRAKTAHLPGVKIAIMGCIVNGPGEMADADFGYVGSKTGKVHLFVGKECVEKDIDASEADKHLIALIKQHGRWIDPVEQK